MHISGECELACTLGSNLADEEVRNAPLPLATTIDMPCNSEL